MIGGWRTPEPDQGLFFMTYSEKLKDPRWQKKRLEVLNRDNFTCISCGSDKHTLHVHHQLYQRGLEPWDYDTNLLITLCEFCHESEEQLKSSDSEFIEMMLSFRLTRLEINSFVLRLWDHLYNKPDRRDALNKLKELIDPTDIPNG